MPQIKKVTTACHVSLDNQGRVELFIYKSLSQQHQSNVFNHWYDFFSTGTSNFNVSVRIRTTTLILVSFTFKKSSILQCRRLLPIAITNKNIFVRLELDNSIFLHLVLLSFTPVASHSFSFPSLRSSYTATLSSTCFWIFLPIRIQSGEETDVGRQRLNHSSLSPSRFSKLNRALDTNDYNWWRVFIFLPQELQTLSDLSSARNILFARITSNEPGCFEGWNKFSVPIWSHWEPKLTHTDEARASLACYQPTLISGTSFFSQWYFPSSGRSANEILWEIVASSPFPCPPQLRRSLARSRETRFTRDRPNRRACSQAMVKNDRLSLYELHVNLLIGLWRYEAG